MDNLFNDRRGDSERYPSDRSFTGECWQNAFIRHNAAVIGYYAWSGFESMGAGLVVCQVEMPPLPLPRLYAWKFKTQFIPLYAVESGLREFGVDSVTMPTLVQAIGRYDPYRDVMLLINAGLQVEVDCFRNSDLSPFDCYLQVRDRWEEFFPCSLLSESPNSLNDH
jgi:hypothetical protein